ncbi:cobalamin biosynthesis protein [Mesorhizobium comanense]|uniref:cobalamin biosynthesis protein n=1 Tax=Mesorhizobium comanense TaxID=2502215 RepID=UPI0010F95CD3|nr:cobalamin biosynthesis protein [Mesorhizobium comanense]
MMVAGIGSRKGVSVEDVLAAIETALEAHGLAMPALSALATAALKKDEAAIAAAGRTLNLPVIIVDDAALRTVETLSKSALSLDVAVTPSVSEASALAAAGKGARLLGPRTVLGPVTCAIAISGDAP